MMYFPRLQWGVTMMANGGRGGQGGAIQVLVYKLIDDMLGIPEQERFDCASMLDFTERLEIETLKKARSIFYPTAPKEKDAIPLSLPLKSYTGVCLHPNTSSPPSHDQLTYIQTYTHSAYPPLTLALKSTISSDPSSPPQKSLHSVFQWEQYPNSLSFHHISSEHFLVYIRWFSTSARSTDSSDIEVGRDSVSKAEFRLGEDGQVKEMGVLLEPEMGGAKIWFQKEKAGAKESDGYEKCTKHSNSFAFGTQSSQDANNAEGQSRLFSNMTGDGMAPLFAYVWHTFGKP